MPHSNVPGPSVCLGELKGGMNSCEVEDGNVYERVAADRLAERTRPNGYSSLLEAETGI